MKTIKNIDIKMTFSVGFSEIEVPDNVYQQLIDASETGIELNEDTKEYAEAYDFLNGRVNSNDAYDWEYEIEDLEKTSKKMSEKTYIPNDIIITEKGVRLIAVPSATDGSGCSVCDDGIDKCYFLDKEEKCPKCHSDEFSLFDHVDGRVIFKELK